MPEQARRLAGFQAQEVYEAYAGASLDCAVTGASNTPRGALIYGEGYREVEDVPSVLFQDPDSFDRRYLYLHNIIEVAPDEL